MDLYEAVDQVVALLQQRGRVSYRSLKRQFELDDDYSKTSKKNYSPLILRRWMTEVGASFGLKRMGSRNAEKRRSYWFTEGFDRRLERCQSLA